MTSKRIYGAVAGAALLVTLGVIGSLALFDSDSGSANSSIIVFDAKDRSTESVASVDAARELAAEKAGFPLSLPTVLPEGYRISRLDIQAPPPPQAGVDIGRVTATVSRGSETFTVLAVSQPFDFPGKDEEHVLSRIGDATLYKSPADGSTEYILISESNGWVANVPAVLQLGDSEVERVMQSLNP